MIDVHSVLRSPYVAGGREIRSGLDCWGLALLVREELGLPSLNEAPGVTRETPLAMNRMYRKAALGLERTLNPEPGALAAVFKGRVMVHVAVALEIDGRLAFLETNPKSGARWMRKDRFEQIYYRVIYYRDRNLSESA